MTDMQLDPRAAGWLDLGPTRAPADSFTTIMAAVDAAPQRRPRLRLMGRPVIVAPRVLAVAAALVVAVAAIGGYVFRDPILDVVAPPPGDLLAPFPETRTFLDVSGGPAAEAATAVIGNLPKGHAFVIAASCTGGGSMPVEVWDRGIEYGPDVPDAERRPERAFDVPCDGSVAVDRFATGMMSSDAIELTADVPAGATWRVAVGQVRGGLDEPTFPALDVTDGTVLMMDARPMFTLRPPGTRHRPAAAAGRRARHGARPVSRRPGHRHQRCRRCSRSTSPAPMQARRRESMWRWRREPRVHAGTDGFAWVRMAVEAPSGPAVGGRPEAPSMPAEIAAITFAEGDGQNVAFGVLGSNSQQVVRVADSIVGHAAGDVVGISRVDGDDAILELWSMRDAAPIRTLATVEGGTIYDSWADATHEQLYYGVTTLTGHEWRRVGFDGTGDAVIASGILAIRHAQAALAVDDAQFVAEWCPIVGSCERAIHDTATGVTTRDTFDGEPPCSIHGVLDGRIVATTSRCDAGVDEGVIGVRDVDGGEWTTILEDWANVGLVDSVDGPTAVLLRDEGTRTVVSAVGLDGAGLREVATFDHETGFGPRHPGSSCPAAGCSSQAPSATRPPERHQVEDRSCSTSRPARPSSFGTCPGTDVTGR